MTTPTEGKKEQVRSMFDRIARRYDLLNRLLSLGIDQRWRRRLVRIAASQHPETILDVATGTGDLAIALARRMPQAAITGIDLSPQMLRIGREKVAAALPERELPLLEGDAELLPFADAAFDAVTVAFGVRNFENLSAGLAQMYRVLRPGGRLYVLEFSMPDSTNKLGSLYRFYFRRVLPTVGRLVSGDRSAYTYLPESVGAFPYGARFETLLRGVGFTAVESRPLMGGIATLYQTQKPLKG